MPFKVIEGSGPSKEERDQQQKELEQQHRREWAQSEFSWAVRDCAANMLRIIRGAGKPHELMRQMQKALNAAIKFQEIHGYWPQDVIANDLRLEDESEKHLDRVREGELEQSTFDRWSEDGTFERMDAKHTMHRGALQIIASQLIAQNVQERAGDREFHDGLRAYERVRDKQRARRQAEARAARVTPIKKPKRKATVADSWADAFPSPRQAAPEKSLSSEVEQNRRSKAFDKDDLRELRKAIKAKDSKKIAELTAKIGSLPLDGKGPPA
jgi:hypothetical protein